MANNELHPAFALLQSMRPYEGREVVEKIMWPLVDFLAEEPWKVQKEEAELDVPSLKISVRGVGYELSVDALHLECEVDVEAYDIDGSVKPLDKNIRGSELAYFPSGLITVHEIVDEDERKRGVHRFRERYPQLVGHIGAKALKVSKVRAFSFDGDNDLEVFDYQAATHPRVPGDYWLLAGIDPRMAEAQILARLEESDSNISLEPSSNSLSESDMQALRVVLRAYRAPKDLMDQMSLLQTLGK